MLKKYLHFNFFVIIYYVSVFFSLFLALSSLTIAIEKREESPPLKCVGSELKECYPKQFVGFLHTTAVSIAGRVFRTREREYNPKGELIKFVVKPRSFFLPLVPITALFLGYTFNSFLEKSRNINDLGKKFYEEKHYNTKVIRASHIHTVTFSSWYSDPRHNRKSFSENYKNIHERLLCMVSIERSLNDVLYNKPSSVDDSFFLKLIYNITKPFTRYLEIPILENGKRLLDRINQEKDHLMIIDKVNYLLTDKNYLEDKALYELIESELTYFNKHLEKDGRKEEIEEFKDDLLKVANLMGVAWGIRCIEEGDQFRAQELCTMALNAFDLVLAFDYEERSERQSRYSATNFNKGFMLYSYMGDLKGGLENLEKARRTFPHHPAIISNIAFCKYRKYRTEDKNEELISELERNLSVLSEALDLYPKDYISRQIKGSLLLKNAILHNKNDPKKSVEYAKKAKREFDEIERMRRDDELKGFEPDQYYYWPKGQSEIATGCNEDALESLRRASYYSGCEDKKSEQSDNSSLAYKDKSPCGSIKKFITVLKEKEKGSWSIKRLLWETDESRFIKDHQSILLEDIDNTIFTPSQVKQIIDENTKVVNTFKAEISKKEKQEKIRYLLDRLSSLATCAEKSFVR